MHLLKTEPQLVPVLVGTRHLIGQWLLAFILCLCVQVFFRSPDAEFWHTDDGVHYVSSAMIANWISSGFGSPMAAALDYNSHYPLVGIGLWGPAFYGIFGVAIAVLGGGKAVALGLTAAIVASLAALTAWGVSQLASRTLAWVAAVLIVILPLCVDQSLAFGLDAPVALGLCGAAFALGHYLTIGSRVSLLLFVTLSLVGLLTKGNALALYLYGPLVLWLTCRFRAIFDWRLWLAVIAITAVALPWYIFSYGLAARGFRAEWGWEFTSHALLVNLQLLYATSGPVLLLLASWGAWRGLTRGGLAGVSLAAALAVYLFQSIVPASLNARYLLSMLPFVLVLASVGGQALLSAAAAHLRPLVAGCLLILLVMSVVALTYPSAKIYHGFGSAAKEARKLLSVINRSVLVVGFDVVETTFIAESAMLQPIKPDLYIIRGSRLLGGGGYNNFDYEPRFNTAEQVADELTKYLVPMIVISTAGRANQWLHVSQVQTLLDKPGGGWRLAWRSTGVEDIRIYLHDDNAKQKGAVDLVKKLSAPRKVAPSPLPGQLPKK